MRSVSATVGQARDIWCDQLINRHDAVAFAVRGERLCELEQLELVDPQQHHAIDPSPVL